MQKTKKKKTWVLRGQHVIWVFLLFLDEHQNVGWKRVDRCVLFYSFPLFAESVRKSLPIPMKSDTSETSLLRASLLCQAFSICL